MKSIFGLDTLKAYLSPPSRGAWIEIKRNCIGNIPGLLSPPSRGAWIEISKYPPPICSPNVAPLAGGVD